MNQPEEVLQVHILQVHRYRFAGVFLGRRRRCGVGTCLLLLKREIRCRLRLRRLLRLNLRDQLRRMILRDGGCRLDGARMAGLAAAGRSRCRCPASCNPALHRHSRVFFTAAARRGCSSPTFSASCQAPCALTCRALPEALFWHWPANGLRSGGLSRLLHRQRLILLGLRRDWLGVDSRRGNTLSPQPRYYGLVHEC